MNPEEAIFTGHDKEEIEGAKRLGIKTANFNKFTLNSLYDFLEKIK